MNCTFSMFFGRMETCWAYQLSKFGCRLTRVNEVCFAVIFEVVGLSHPLSMYFGECRTQSAEMKLIKKTENAFCKMQYNKTSQIYFPPMNDLVCTTHRRHFISIAIYQHWLTRLSSKIEKKTSTSHRTEQKETDNSVFFWKKSRTIQNRMRLQKKNAKKNAIHSKLF